MTKKQLTTKLTSERIVLIVCTVIILIMAVTTFWFLLYWYLFLALLIINALVLFNKVRMNESLSRFLMLINIFVAAISILLIVGWKAGWLLQ